MKKILLLCFTLFCIASLLRGQVSKTITATAGSLNSAFTMTEKLTVTNLTINGTIDASDFRILRDSMRVLKVLDIRNVNIAEYKGLWGTYNMGTYTEFPENAIPGYGLYNTGVTTIYLPNTLVGINGYGLSKTKITTITVPEGVTYLAGDAFSELSELLSVSLPNSLKSIGNYAFKNDTKLTSIVIPNNVATIGSNVFESCTALKTVTLSTSLSAISLGLFRNCSALTSVNIPNTVTRIEVSAFRECVALTSIVLPEGLTTIGAFAFDHATGLVAVNIPSTVSTIGRDAFKSTAITSIAIPAGITKLETNSFAYCSKLTSVHVFSSTPPSMGTEVFQDLAFHNCTLNVPSGSEAAYKVADQWENFTKVTGQSYSVSLSKSYFDMIAGASSGSLSITSNTYWKATHNYDWITVVNSTGFGNASFNFNVTANPDTFVRTGAIVISGDAATPRTITINQAATTPSLKLSKEIHSFSGNTPQTDTIYITSNVTWSLTSDSPWVTFSQTSGTGSKKVVITVAENTGQKFRVATVTATTHDVTPIKVKVTHGDIPDVTITAGGLSAAINDFEKGSVTNLTIKGTLDARDFKFMRDSMTYLSVVDISGASIVAYTGTEGTATGSITYNANTIPQYAFYNNNTSLGKKTLTQIMLPTSVTAINSYAFQSTGLTSIVLPEGFMTLGAASFRYCYGLKEIEFPSSLTSLGSSTFSGCLQLKIIVIPNGITTIGGYTFAECSNLEIVYIPSSVATIGNYAFRGCPKLSDIYAMPATPVDLSTATSAFTGMDKTVCKLIVPTASVSAYKTAVVWKDFNHIAALTPTFSLTPVTISATAVASQKSITVTTNTFGTVSSDQSWAVLQQKNFNGNITVVVDIAENLALVARTAILTFAPQGGTQQQVTITQAAAVKKLAVSPATLSYTSVASNKSVEITANVDWSASSNAAWLTIDKATGSGSATLVCSAAENTGATSRTAKVTLSATGLTSHVIYVTQSGAPAQLIPTPSVTTILSSGGTLTVNVVSNCEWAISSSNTWLRPSVSSGNGNVTLTCTADNNATTAIRSATLTFSAAGVANQVITFTQGAASPMVEISPATLGFYASGGSASVTVTSNTSWSISSNQTWLSLNKSTGTGGSTFVCTADANTQTSARTATVTITATGVTAKTITIGQDGVGLALSVSETSLTFAVAGENKVVNITSNTSWSASDDADWLTLSTESGTNNGQLTINAEANSSLSSRIGTITISGDGVSNRIITITQDGTGTTLLVSESSLSFSASGESKQVDITSNASWTVSADADWVTLSVVSGSNNGLFTITTAANTTQYQRTAIITIAASGVGNRTISVTQDAVIQTGIEGVDKIGFSIYPNPTQDVVYIKSDNARINVVSVIDLSGKTMLIEPEFSQDDSVDLSSLKIGIYFIKIQTANKVLTRKVVKK